VRFAALVALGAEPPVGPDALESAAQQLRRAAGLFSSVQSSIRYALAAMILRRGLDPARSWGEVERARAGFRERRLRRGGLCEILAALVLVLRSDGARVSGATLDRMATLLRSWKQAHPWLTGQDDYPLAALHASGGDPLDAIADATERIYRGLHAAGFYRGNALQRASHVLAVESWSVEEAVRRFASIAEALRRRDVTVRSSHYGDLALLCLAAPAPDALAAEVVDAVARLRSAPHRPSGSIAFALACGIALSRRDRLDARDVSAAATLLAALEVAQGAAVVAAIAASS
jgi:uncharacterized protein DUF4003